MDTLPTSGQEQGGGGYGVGRLCEGGWTVWVGVVGVGGGYVSVGFVRVGGICGVALRFVFSVGDEEMYGDQGKCCHCQ